MTKILDQFKTLPNRPILYALVAADLLFIVLHILHLLPTQAFPIFQENAFSVKEDRGLAESFQYVKEFWIALIFFWLVFRRRRYALLGLALLFVFLLLDDMVSIHETLGDMAAGMFANNALLDTFTKLRADDLGELFAAGSLGLFFMATISLPYRRANGERPIFHTVFALLAVFAVFAIGVDFLNGFVSLRILRDMVGLVEDTGEMLVMSLICWYALSLVGEFQRRDGA